MNTVYTTAAITLVTMLCASVVACSNDDDDNIAVGHNYTEALEQRFPGAKGVKWELESSYRVAEFIYNGNETDAWFDGSAAWCMTETDYRTDTSKLPAAVVESISTGEYASWIIDDIDLYERTDLTFYVIELESRGMPDVYLYYAIDGRLITSRTEPAPDIWPNTPILQ